MCTVMWVGKEVGVQCGSAARKRVSGEVQTCMAFWHVEVHACMRMCGVRMQFGFADLLCWDIAVTDKKSVGSRKAIQVAAV